MSESVQRSEYIKALDRVHDRIDEHAKDDTRVFESINKKLDTLIDRQVDHHTEAVKVIAGMAQQQIEIAELKKKVEDLERWKWRTIIWAVVISSGGSFTLEKLVGLVIGK